MRIAVFGATGGTGRQVVSQALEKQHTVTAFARAPHKAGPTREGLTVIQGDALEFEAVARAVDGQDAVICAIGATATKAGRVRSESTRHMLAAMEKAGIRRFVAQSTIGMGETRPMLGPKYRWLLIPLLLRPTFADTARQEAVIQESDVDWTIVRCGALTDGERTGRYEHATGTATSKVKGKISRADAAEFLLKQLEDDTYVRKAPYLTY
ncbi:SDR family oxidoreductase [Streptomyces sp. A7024]|uniref:SDR family oxidoreductase n=1 Tax=Streptomyces coryli TaxID=1128680 RepID=A0A6G4U3T0_9ACTN|nr:SDR family oxidoreductase [Streptomyces coryli]NGN66743.1 SDR family oxidoreductase [Streptomyces coryli]